MHSFIDRIRDNPFIVILVVIITGFIILALTQKSDTPNRRDIQIEGVQTFSINERGHVSGDVPYEQSPPVGGKHAGTWVGCNGQAYSEPIPEELAVHALEHGAVWVTYQPDLDQQAVAKLKEKVEASNYTFMSPYQGLEQKIVLSAWNNQLVVDGIDDPRIDDFIKKFRQGSQTPEPGATCLAPQGAM